MWTYFLILKLLFYNISAVIQQSTEINLGVESVEGQEGEFFFDLNYIYIKIKRTVKKFLYAVKPKSPANSEFL